MLYHASKQAGLKELIPHLSTHGKNYVYAIRSRSTALLFGAPKDDFDILIDEADGKTLIFECYPDALRKIYAGKTCSLYTLEEEGFLSDQTGWDAELVCEHAVPVVSEERIDDIHEELLVSHHRGDCIFHAYSTGAEYQDFLREELSERVRSFGISDAQREADPRFQLYFNQLLTGLEETT